MNQHVRLRPVPAGARTSRVLPLALASSLLVVACGGGGGGGGGPTVGFVGGSSSATEGTSAPVVLELRTGGGTLSEDVTVVVSDAGSGTATSGSDYTALPPLTVTFTAGAQHLDTFTLLVDLTDDSSVEGADETVALELEAQGDGVGIRGSGAYTLTVVDGDRATVGFTSGTTVTPDEGDATYTATVALALDPGDTLGVDVSVDVADAGTGTAESGVDYDAFAPRTVTFAAGSPDGTGVDVQLTVRDDADSELHETAVLTLAGASAGVELGAFASHVLTITEDDASPDPFLDPRADDVPGGNLVALAAGEARDFGAQTLDAGPSARVRLELTNAGLQAMAWSAPQLTGDTRDFRIETQLGSAPPAGGFTGGGAAGLVVAPVPLGAAPLAAPVGVAFEYAPELAAALAAERSLVLDGLVTPEGEVLALALGQRPLPVAADAVLVVDGEPRAGGLAAALAGVTIWSGHVVEHPGSDVFLTTSPDGLQGWVRLPGTDGPRVLHLLPARDGALVVVADDVDVAALAPLGGPQPCLAGLEAPDALGPAPGPGSGAGTAGLGLGVGFATARIAVETDYHYYALFGDQTAATTYATQLFAAVSEVYERDAQASLELAYLGIYTTPSDPWSAGDAPGDDTLDLLNEFQQDWSSGGWPVSADLAHFVSGASLGGGIAYLDVLCSQVYGFGVSANIGGGIDWGTFSGNAGSLTWDFVVVAHELGHNFGAQHTHDYCPPLDTCATNCGGTTACSQSTLMSYCHTCGGMTKIDLGFHPYNAEVMRDNVRTSCLDDANLDPGATVTFDLRFEPVSGAGAKAATLSFTHDGVNAPSPFTLDLSGTAQ